MLARVSLLGLDHRKRHRRVVHILATTLGVSFAAADPPKRQPTGPTNPTSTVLPGPRTFLLTKMTTHASNPIWLSRTRVQALFHDTAADAFRGKDTVLDWFAAIIQVASREGSAVCSPEGMHDDRADSNALAG